MDSSPGEFVQRHVLPENVAPPIDDDGFLRLGEGRSWIFASVPTPVELEVLAGDPESFTLLASDGVGKTRALRHLHSLEPGSAWIDLSHYSIDGLRSELDRIAVPGAQVFIDAVDIALLYQPLVSELLAARIEDPALRGVSWRIACRPASWNSRLSDAFYTHVKAQAGGQGLSFPSKRQYTLLPLARSAVLSLAGQTVAEPHRFVHALTEARLGRLSGYPGRIASVAKRWENSGDLPDSQSEALAFEIRELLSEYNSAHQSDALNMRRKQVIAERLGAFTMFCSAERYRTDDRHEPNVTAIGNLPFEAEPAEPGVEYPPSHYREVLGTALFDLAPDGAIGFRHQQYAEFLAARYLVNRRVPADKIRMLLSVTENGSLPSAMVGVAAWIAALKPDLIRSAVLSNATAFLKSRVDLPSDELRRDLVDRILTDAAAEDIDLLFGYRFTNLTHPGLEAQLMRRMEQGDIGALELWWIGRLADDARCTTLCEPLLGHLDLPLLPSWARRACVKTIGMMGTLDQRRSLVPLLDLPVSEDPGDEVFAGVIEATYPEVLPIDHLLDALRPRRDEDLVGAYLVLLGDLPNRMPPHDLPKTLDWASEHAAKSQEGFGQFVPQLVATAWTSPQVTALLPRIGKLVAACAEIGHWGQSPLGTEPPWVQESNLELRRRLLLAVLEHVDEIHSYRLDNLQLFTDHDSLWAIDILPELDEPAQTILATWVAHVPDPSVELIETVLALTGDHPAYEPTSFWRGAVPIDHPAAAWRRKQLAEGQKTSAEDAEIRAERESALQHAIADTDTDPRQWWRISLALLTNDKREDWFDFDITKRGGWNSLDPDQQRHVLDLGHQYLRLHQLKPATWLAESSVTDRQVMPDWSGAHLLATVARHWPDQLAALEADIWRRWAPAIIGAWDPDPSTNNDTRRTLMDCVPEAATDAYIDALLEQLDAYERAEQLLSSNPSIEWAARAAATEISERLVAGAYTGNLAYALLALLAELDETQTLTMCWELLGDLESKLRPRAARLLAELAPNEMVAHMLAGPWANQDLHAFVSRIVLPKLDIEDLEALAKFLLDRFPLADDPPFEGGWMGEWNIHDTLQTRGRSLGRLADLGQIHVLERLAQDRGLAEANYLKHLVRRARTSAADLAVRPIEPHELLRLLELADARIIRTAADLLTAALHQLETIQHQLKSTGLFRDVWNDSSDVSTPKSEDSISDWLQRELEHRLGRPIFIDREIQVRRRAEHGIGTRIDLTFSTTSDTRNSMELRLITEAKLVNNSEVDTALELQLYQRYMEPLQLSHGIYLVFWIQPDQRPHPWSRTKHPTLEGLQEKLQDQAETLHNVKIVPFVLDISRPV
jgi:hypothetical protein